MKATLRLLLALPTWLFAVPVLIVTVTFDVLTWPLVRLSNRDTEPDTPPSNCNAAILILNWNGIDFLRELMPSVRIAVDNARELGEHEVLVIDNGSDDDSVAFVEREHNWARVVQLETNLHFIRGNRAGMKAVSEDKAILIFLNNDMVVEPDFLSALLQPFTASGENAPPPRSLFATTARIEMAGEHAVETGRTRAFYKRGSLRQEQLVLGDRSELGTEAALWAGGGSSAFDRVKFESLGGFDELYVPCYMEDFDVGYRAWKRGWRIEFVPSAIVHHVHRGTSERVFGRRGIETLDRRNRELFFWRNITDLRWLLSRAFHMPWNAFKDARPDRSEGGLVSQFAALLRSLPRLPMALAGRVRVRTTAHRRDRDVLSL